MSAAGKSAPVPFGPIRSVHGMAGVSSPQPYSHFLPNLHTF